MVDIRAAHSTIGIKQQTTRLQHPHQQDILFSQVSSYITTSTTSLVLLQEGKWFDVLFQIKANRPNRLSAIALGRLRMSVDAVISMYGTIGTEVFGKPQWRLRPKWTKLVFDKYSSKRFSKALATAFDKASPAHGHGLSNTSLKDMRIEGART